MKLISFAHARRMLERAGDYTFPDFVAEYGVRDRYCYLDVERFLAG